MVDLRRRFGMAPTDDTDETCIVVVEVGREGESSFQVGCIVDTVSEVLAVEAGQFEATPRCANAAGDYVAGLAKLKDRVMILLDIEKVVGELAPTLAAAGSGA